MTSWAFILLLAFSLLLLWRLRDTGRRLRDLAEAVEQRRSYLPESHPLWWFAPAMDRLCRACNNLVASSVQANRAQRNVLRQIEATLGTIREAVFIVDRDNVVLMANDVLRQYLGQEQPPLGHRLELLLPSPEFLEYTRAVQRGEARTREEIEIRRGRESRWFEVVGSSLAETDPERESLTLFVLHEVTERKRLETVRTEFVANVSHELRTPVTVIKGFADTLVEDHRQLDEEQRERFLTKIQRNVARLEALLADLLTLSRLEASADSLSREPQSFRAVVRETCETLQDRLAPGQSMVLDCEDGPDQALIDPFRISQVLENLIENARRHAVGMKTITVSTRSHDGFIHCTVADDGAGIPHADLTRIFERFYRVDKGRSRERGGTGLGLAIVKHIVQQHGGTVWAESQPPQGTRFHFQIPLLPSD